MPSPFDAWRATIESEWEMQQKISPTLCPGELREAIMGTVQALDSGELSVVEKKGDQWVVHPWLKKAILLYFQIMPFHQTWCAYDKIPLKCTDWQEEEFQRAGFRLVPGAVVRFGSCIMPRAIIMSQAFVNTGAYIGEGTMIDGHAHVGSCAFVGENCHISAGSVLGGVLEPPQAQPVIIEKHCFIGAQCAIVEGVRVGEGAVISIGCRIGASTKIVNRETGQVSYGLIPPGAVVIPGGISLSQGLGVSENIQTACVIIVKTVDEKTRAKTSINALLREDTV